MDKSEEEQTNPLNNKKNLSIPDIYFEEFLNSITENRIKNLYLKLKLYESKGFITHDKYLQSMKEIFDDPIKEQIKTKEEEINYNTNANTNTNIDINTMEEIINEIYELYFLRFREIKCIIQNNKTVFYLTDFKPENYINSYHVICSLTIFLKSCFENKIRLLFNITDIDEDGFLNEYEIIQMITTCNFLFCEEGNIINTNSSILAQSLTNYKVNDILKELLYEPGNLYLVLEEEKYINFDLLYKSIKLIKDYKYRIIPYYINLKQCLNNIKKEKVIKINDKHKYDFIKISSSLVGNKTIGSYRSLKNQKSFSCPYLSGILKPKKITKNNESNSKLELPNINKSFFYKRNSITRYTKKAFYKNMTKSKINENSLNKLNKSLFSNTSVINRHGNNNKLIIEKKKTFKELIRETNIIEMRDEKSKMNETNKNFNKNNYYNRDNREIKYIFEANFDKIRNIEVEPGLIKFINNDNYNISSSSNLNTNLNSNLSNSHNVNNILRQNNENKKKYGEKNVGFTLNKEKGKEITNNVVQEEKSSDDQENKSKTSNQDGKKLKKIKLINYSENVNEKNKNIININNKDKKIDVNLNSKNINQENINKLANFYRLQNSRQSTLRKKVNFFNKNGLNMQKNMNSSLNEGKRYKTLDEVFLEIKFQENKYNSDSYGGVGISLMNGLNRIKEERKDIKRLLGDSDKKDLSMAFHKNYLTKLSKKKEKKITKSKSAN